MKGKELNLEQEKLEIIKWISTLKDETAIERIKLLKERKNKDWWKEISDAEKIAIEKGLEDLKSRKVKPHKDVKKIYAKWL
jgi:hypothetical protein